VADFGGAVGLMMMAMWSLPTTSADLKAMAPARVANGAAVVWFIAAGAVRWPEMLAMLVASAVGGYLGARLTQWLPARLVRGFHRRSHRDGNRRVLHARNLSRPRADRE